MTDNTGHAEWAPSSASIWLNCPGSIQLNPLYKETGLTDAADLGTLAHGVLEDCITFGTKPQHPDEDINEGVDLALDFVHDVLEKYKKVTIIAEKRLVLPDTPVWGTTDLVAVNDDMIHIADYKHGWVPVNVKMNAQLMTYLAAAIAEYGERKKYKITVIQPKYDHIDGKVRTYEPSQEDVDWHQSEIRYALNNPDKFHAGKHCKYCKARGACKVFAGWLVPRLQTVMYWEISERHTYDNETLAKLLDFLDLVPGFISAVRQEAFKRALNDRAIGGYKIVKGKAERKIVDEEHIKQKYLEIGIPVEALYEASFVSPLTVEKQIKGHYRAKGRNAWKEPWEEISKAIQTERGGMQLVRDIDGRPQFNKGDEFGELPVQDGDIFV